MIYNRAKHHRRSLRLQGYDYRQTGAYFVTLCTHNRTCFFGAVLDGKVQLNDAGRMAEAAWNDLPARLTHVNLDALVVMPNHTHGILIVGAQFIAPDHLPQPCRDYAQQGAINRAPTLGKIVRTYKAVSVRMIRQRLNSTFAWQRNYYEHVIRNEESLNRIRQYILDNPARWQFDPENPAATNIEPKDAWYT